MSQSIDESRAPAAVALRGKQIEKLLAASFRAHWKALEKELANGIDVAKERAEFFFGSDRRTRLRLARRYYTPARATKFANAAIAEILDLCWAWFIPFQIFALNEKPELSELRDRLDQLVTAEYVAMQWQLFEHDKPDYELDWDNIDDLRCYACPSLYPLPDLTTRLGDVYEGIVVDEAGDYLRVSKSVVEPFRSIERVDAMAGIAQQFFQNAVDQGRDPRTWRVDFRYPESSRCWIEADFLPQVGSAYEKKYHRMLFAELKGNDQRYFKRLRPCL